MTYIYIMHKYCFVDSSSGCGVKIVMHRIRAIGSWTDWKREDKAENRGVVLPRLQMTTYVSTMNNNEKYYRYYYLYNTVVKWVQQN